MKRYLDDIVRIEVVHVEPNGSDAAMVHVRTTVRRADLPPHVQENDLPVHRGGNVWLVSLPFLGAMSEQTGRVERSRAALVLVTRDVQAGRINEPYDALDARAQALRRLTSAGTTFR